MEEENDGRPVKIVANLPYYITTPIIMGLFESHVPLESITIMVQKEVADRCRPVRVRRIMVHYPLLCNTTQIQRLLQMIPPNCFMPRPNVASAVIRLTRHRECPVEVLDEKIMFRIIRAAFNQRRKTLQNSIHNAADLNFSKEQVVAALEEMQLSQTVRGEVLSLKQFAELTNLLVKNS